MFAESSLAVPIPLWFSRIGDSSHSESVEPAHTSRPALAATDRRTVFELPDDFVARIRARDESAVDLLFRQAFTPLTRFAYSFVKSSDVAEDVVQDVLVRLWNHGAQWSPRVSVTAYLYGAVRNQALNVLRSRGTDLRLRDRVSTSIDAGQPSAGVPAIPETPEQLAHRHALADVFDHALASLTERQRTAVLLRYEQGRTVSDVAAVLEIATRAAEKLLSRAVRQLRDQLETRV